MKRALLLDLVLLLEFYEYFPLWNEFSDRRYHPTHDSVFRGSQDVFLIDALLARRHTRREKRTNSLHRFDHHERSTSRYGLPLLHEYLHNPRRYTPVQSVLVPRIKKMVLTHRSPGTPNRTDDGSLQLNQPLFNPDLDASHVLFSNIKETELLSSRCRLARFRDDIDRGQLVLQQSREGRRSRRWSVGRRREGREGSRVAFKVDDGDVVRSIRGSSDGHSGLATALAAFVELDRALEGVDAAYSEASESNGGPGIGRGSDGRGEFTKGDKETCLSERSGGCGGCRCKESIVVFLTPNDGSVNQSDCRMDGDSRE